MATELQGGPWIEEGRYTREMTHQMIVRLGQSNGSGRGALPSALVSNADLTVFRNDYTFAQAAEPMDDPTGQLDAVSSDAGLAGHSSGLKLLLDLQAARPGPYTFVPASKGGSSMAQWAVSTTNPFDRGTLAGSMLTRTRAVMAARRDLLVLSWHQGEADCGSQALIDAYPAAFKAMLAAMRTYLGWCPVSFAQLGMYPGTNQVLLANFMEMQRRLEGSSGYAEAIPGAFLTVTHDLPMNSDLLHLNTPAQLEYGRREALNIRANVFVDGTVAGPRLVSVTRPTSTTIKVKTTVPINDAVANYDGYFSVLDGAAAATIGSVVRDPADNTAALVTLAAAPVGAVTVTYMPPARAAGAWAVNCIRAAAVTPGLTYGQPLPAFKVTL